MAVIFTLVIINNPAFGITPLERAVINDERLVNLSGATLGEHIISRFRLLQKSPIPKRRTRTLYTSFR
jgi:hypothetical protein